MSGLPAAMSVIAVARTVLAMTDDRTGDGTLANVALDRALVSDPAYRLARCLATTSRRQCLRWSRGFLFLSGSCSTDTIGTMDNPNRVSWLPFADTRPIPISWSMKHCTRKREIESSEVEFTSWRRLPSPCQIGSRMGRIDVSVVSQ